MKHKGFIKIGILFCLIILLTGSSSATTLFQKSPEKKSLFHLQFALIISWDPTNTSTPIAAGETREVPLQIISMVTRGAFGKLLLRFLQVELIVLNYQL